MYVVGFTVELDQLALEVGTHIAEDRLQSGQVCVREHRVPKLGNENQVCVHGVNHMPASTNIHLLIHEDQVYIR